MKRRRNPLYRTGKHLLFSSELPEGRSNKVRYFLPSMTKPWRAGKSGFGPEWDDVMDKSKRQAALILAMRNPRKNLKIVRVKCGKRTLEVRLYKRSR